MTSLGRNYKLSVDLLPDNNASVTFDCDGESVPVLYTKFRLPVMHNECCLSENRPVLAERVRHDDASTTFVPCDAARLLSLSFRNPGCCDSRGYPVRHTFIVPLNMLLNHSLLIDVNEPSVSGISRGMLLTFSLHDAVYTIAATSNGSDVNYYDGLVKAYACVMRVAWVAHYSVFVAFDMPILCEWDITIEPHKL